MNKLAKITGIIESAEAERVFRESTGRGLPPIPEGANTLRTPFVFADGEGVPRAALLVQQRGFEQTALERLAGEEPDGAAVFIAADIPPEDGARLLDSLVDSVIAPHELAGAGREVLFPGVSVRYAPAGDGIEAIRTAGGELTGREEIAAWLAAHPAAADEIQSTRVWIRKKTREI